MHNNAAPAVCIAADACLRHNSTVIFMGDSITRYQYLDLVNTLHSGGSLRHSAVSSRSPLYSRGFGSWSDFLSATTNALAPREICDCHRLGKPVSPSHGEKWENRLYKLPSCNGNGTNGVCAHRHQSFAPRVAYIGVDGAGPVLGNLPLKGQPWADMWNHTGIYRGPATNGKTAWALEWSEVISRLVSLLRPTVLVLNAGHHTSAASLDFAQIRSAAAAVTPCVVWKTPTPSWKGVLEPRVAHVAHAASRAFAGDVIFDTGRIVQQVASQWNMSDPGRLFADPLHFAPRSNVYHHLNAAMLKQVAVECEYY